jgi:hypothetical protein
LTHSTLGCDPRAHLDALDDSVEVAILAQASMALAAQLASGSTPVLTSPRLAVEAAVAKARAVRM